jgi:AcrR family transcriptional regulator
MICILVAVASIAPSRTQAERRARTRARLIEATIASIAEHGYQATTTRRVADLADSSLGALGHHFASRLELITASLDSVGQQAVARLRTDTASAVRETGPALDLLWMFFDSTLFTVWIKVWLAAAEDSDLHQRLVPIEARLNASIARAVADLKPPTLPTRSWTPRLRAAIHTMRGLALSLAIEPRASEPVRDPWPATRRELTAMINRPA